MNRYRLSFILLFLVLFPAVNASPHRIEFSVGALIDEGTIDFSTSFPYNYGYANLSAGYAYSFNDKFSLGGWIGVMRNVPPPVIGGVKLIFGDMGGFAFSLNLGIIPSIGLYFKNFFLNAMVGMIYERTDYYPPDYEPVVQTVVAPYLEIGYSIKIGK
jgi:hypothetical protein